MSNKYIYDKVKSLIKKYKTRDPAKLAEAMNINIYPLNGCKHLLGMYNVIERNRCIFLSTDAGPLKKTILAHELGHDQLHRAHCSNGTAFHENKVFNPTNLYEQEANIFACHLLISDEDVLCSLEQGMRDVELAGMLGVDINLLNLKISEMAKLGLLNGYALNSIDRPKSDFLKDYKPQPDDWMGC